MKAKIALFSTDFLLILFWSKPFYDTGQLIFVFTGPGTNARAKPPENRVQIVDPTGVWSPGNRVQMFDPTGVWTPGNRVQIIDPTDPNARAASVNNGRMSNAMTIQNGTVKSEYNFHEKYS